VKLKAIDWQSSMKLAGRAQGSACRAERIQHSPPPVRGSISGTLVVQTLRTFAWTTTAPSGCGCVTRVNVAAGAPAG